MGGPGDAGWRGVAGRVAEVATDVLGEALRGVYVHGSAALGGWGPGSDVDMILVVAPAGSADWTPVGEAFATTGRGVALEVSVVATRGLGLYGPPPAALIGPVPRADVIDSLAAELDWAVAHADAKYVVLNACRAHAYAATGHLLSKLDGAHWARPVHPTCAGLIERAHRAQRDGFDLGSADTDSVALVRAVQQSLAQRRPTHFQPR